MRFVAHDWDELTESVAQGLAEQAAEATDGRGGGGGAGFVVDTEAEDGPRVVAFIPGEVGGIEGPDLAQRVAVLVAMGEPTEAAEPDQELLDRAQAMWREANAERGVEFPEQERWADLRDEVKGHWLRAAAREHAEGRAKLTAAEVNSFTKTLEQFKRLEEDVIHANRSEPLSSRAERIEELVRARHELGVAVAALTVWTGPTAGAERPSIEDGELLMAARQVLTSVVSSGSGPVAPVFDVHDAEVERNRGPWKVIDAAAIDRLKAAVDAA